MNLKVLRIPVLALAASSLAFLALNALAATYYVNANGPNPTPPYTNWSTAATNIQDAVDVATSGDLVLVTNGVYQPGGRPAPDNIQTCVVSTNAVTIQSVNGSTGTSINGSGDRRCAYLGNGAVFSGFTVTDGKVTNTYPSTCGGIYCASNALVENCLIINNAANNAAGLYFGTASNCVISGNTSVQQGGGALLSTLINCTVSGNYSSGTGEGGGVASCYLTNCVLTGNSVVSGGQGGGALQSTLNSCTLSNNSGTLGGGAAFCTLNNCLVFSNSVNNQYTGSGAFSQGGGLAYGYATNCIILHNAAYLDEHSSGAVAYGGGAYETTLANCTVVDNYAVSAGGGTYGSPAYNSIIYYNTSYFFGVGVGTSNVTIGTLSNCCTFPLPSSGLFNFTNAPLFVSISGTGGNLHLQSNSPCINAGNNAYAAGATDLDGNPRIVGGTVDVGAYEYQTPSSVISYAYLQQYGLPTDGMDDYLDLDGTGFNVYQDWIAGLNPTNAASVLAMLPPVATNNAAGITVSWESVGGISYNLQRSTNLAAQPAFSTIQTNITGQAGTTSYTDTTATNGVPYFYRVNVQH